MTKEELKKITEGIKNQVKTFLFYTSDGNIFTEVKRKDGEMRGSDDCIMLGTAEGKSAESALKNLLKENVYLRDYDISDITAYEISGDAKFLTI